MANPWEMFQEQTEQESKPWERFESPSDEVSEESVQPAKAERSFLEKAGRVAGQYGLGVAENAVLPYELSVAPLASKEAQTVGFRREIAKDLEQLASKKASIGLDPAEEKFYQSLQDQIKNPLKNEEFVKTADLSLANLAEKATGIETKAEAALEKGAKWSGFLKNPEKVAQLAKTGMSVPSLLKNLAPTGTEALRGLGAGLGLEFAEGGEYGPIGTMAAAIIGDLSGAGLKAGVKGAIKAGTKLAENPKKALAEVAASFTSKDKLDIQKQIIEDFKKSGIQADLGSLTDNRLLQSMQTRLAQSGLTGDGLKKLQSELTNQIKSEYSSLADGLGELRYSTNHEAGQAITDSIKASREADLSSVRDLYAGASEALKDESSTIANELWSSIEQVEKKLKPGSLKSTEQSSVIKALDTIKSDIRTAKDGSKIASVKDLINNKIALNDMISYEVQGGAKQLLKGAVADLDKAIVAYGKENPKFANLYIRANKRFSDHAKMFRNKNVDQILRAADPATVLNKMNSVQGIKDIEKVLNTSPEGRKAFQSLKRYKLDKTIGDQMVDSTTQQLKLGTFSKLLEKGKNKEIFKEILGDKRYAKLETLQKNSGALAKSANEFFNASKSGVHIADAAIVGKMMHDFGSLLAGNPWPLAKSGALALSVNRLSNLISDPKFLKYVEEAILATEKASPKELIESAINLQPYAKLYAEKNSKKDEKQDKL